jgi:NTP-dependent ternary system trypsin peptidase co-occuring protein
LSGENNGIERVASIVGLSEHRGAEGGGAVVAYLLGLPMEADGKDVLVFEVDRNEVSDDLVLASPEPGKVAARAQVTLEEALAKLKPSLQKVVHLLKEVSPDETVVEFGLKIGGETGVIIAKGTAEVNFTIRMSWKPE